MSLELRLAIRIVLAVVAMSVIIFLPAGTWEFWQGWAFLSAFVLPSILLYLYFLRYDRALVERRMHTRETVPEQRQLMRVYFLLFLGAFLLPDFDHRLGWSRQWVGEVPVWVTFIALTLVVGGFLFVFWVLKTNSYAGRTIRVDEGAEGDLDRTVCLGPASHVSGYRCVVDFRPAGARFVGGVGRLRADDSALGHTPAERREGAKRGVAGLCGLLPQNALPSDSLCLVRLSPCPACPTARNVLVLVQRVECDVTPVPPPASPCETPSRTSAASACPCSCSAARDGSWPSASARQEVCTPRHGQTPNLCAN